jgi:hypothetical protein
VTLRLARTRVERCEDYPEVTRPARRGDCACEPRPCPFVGCRYHLFLDALPARERGMPGIKFNFADKEPWELEETCALDIADRGGSTLEQVATAMNLTRERVRQIEQVLLSKVATALAPEVIP